MVFEHIFGFWENFFFTYLYLTSVSSASLLDAFIMKYMCSKGGFLQFPEFVKGRLMIVIKLTQS